MICYSCRFIQGNKWWGNAKLPEALPEGKALHSFLSGISWYPESWSGEGFGDYSATKAYIAVDRHGAGWVWGDHTPWCEHGGRDKEEATSSAGGIWGGWGYAWWCSESAVRSAVIRACDVIWWSRLCYFLAACAGLNITSVWSKRFWQANTVEFIVQEIISQKTS